MNTSPNTKLRVYCSSSFEWKGKKGTSKQSELIKLDTKHMVGDYAGVLIKSTKTGDEKYFEPVYDEDGYDGEFMVYKCQDIFISIWNY
jgi:hypothetical protein